MAYKGDIAPSTTLNFKFCTVNASGAPATLTGATVKAYRDDDTSTEVTTGITLSADFDSITGLNNVKVVTSDAFYAAGSEFELVITAGTVNSVSVAGYVVGSFSINNRSSLRPTTAGRTLDVSSGGEAGLDWANIGSPTTTVNLSGTTIKTSTDIQALLPMALVGGRMDSSVGAYQSGLTPLQPTIAGRTLDVTATGGAGIDWSNVEAPTTTLNLSGTTIKAVTDAPTGALTTTHFDAVIGTPVNGTVTADIAQVEANVLAIDVELNGALTLAQFLALK